MSLDESSYILLPFQFEKVDTGDFLLTNDAGDFIYVGPDEFDRLVSSDIDRDSETYVNPWRNYLPTEMNFCVCCVRWRIADV